MPEEPNYEQLTVVRVLPTSLTEGKRSANYHGSRLRNPEFGEVRDASAAAEIKARYKVLRQKPEYADELPPASTKDNVVAALEEWESQHPQSCMRMRDDGQFFGFTGVGRGYLGQYTKFLLIPAVREAGADASEGKGSPITELMDLLVRGVLAEREDVSNLRRELQEKYEEVLRPTKENELSQLESDLTGGLQTYVPDAEVRLSWEKTGGIEVPLPRAAVKLVEDGYQASVERTGHGLQRAFILTLLQQLAAAQDRKGVPPREERPGPSAQGQSSEKDAMPNLLLGIEEPELFQHPSRHLLIRLFQQAPRYRVGRGPAAVSEESASVSGGVRDRGGLPEVPGCLSLARRVPLSSVWASAGLHSRAETTVAVRGVSTPGLVDVGNGAPQYEDPADGLVLGCVPDDN